MTPSEVVDRLESGDTSALRSSQGLPGISEMFFLRVARLLTSDPLGAANLGQFWRQVLRYGDRPEYAYRAHGAALRAAGKWRQSASAFVKAGELCLDPSEKEIFSLGAIDSLARAGRTKEAVQFGRCRARSLRRLGDKLSAARADLNSANALVWQDRYDLASRLYRRVVSEVPSGYERASAQLGLSTCLLFSGKLDEAERFASEAATGFIDLEMGHYARLADINLAHISLLQGKADDAWDLLRSLSEEVASTPDLARISEYLGDVFFQLNLFAEAKGSYEEAIDLAKDMPLNRANAYLGLGRVWHELDSDEAALRCLRKARSLYGKIGNRVWFLVADSEIALLRCRPSDLCRIAVELEEANARYWACRAWKHAASLGWEDALAPAKRICRRFGYLSEKWSIDYLDAKASGSLRRLRKCAKSILEERLGTRSMAARLGFLRSRRVVVLDLLGRLIERGDRGSLDEALTWVQRTRSIALIDEIVQSPALKPIQVAVEEFRQSLVNDDSAPGGSRRARGRALSVSALTDVLDRSAEVSEANLDGTVWIDFGDQLACLHSGRGKVRPSGCVRKTVKWLQFEVSTGALDPGGDPSDAMELADELRILLGPEGKIHFPDGVLWSLPWPLICDTEPILGLSPLMQGCGNTTLPPNPRVAIWAHRAADLPHVATEVDAVRRAFPNAQVFSSSSEIRRNLNTEYDYIHVSTHAHFNAANPMFSHFEFDDGPLYAIEVARSGLKTKLAVLAACETGKLALELPDEPSGFVRAFLACGSSDVAAGLWPVDDAATAHLVGVTAERLAMGTTISDSLAAGRASCRSKYPQPYHWGSMVIFGGYTQ